MGLFYDAPKPTQGVSVGPLLLEHRQTNYRLTHLSSID